MNGQGMDMEMDMDMDMEMDMDMDIDMGMGMGRLGNSLCTGAVARIKKGGARALKAGGLWIYDNEIAVVEGDCPDGGILAVRDFDGFFLGWGFLNRQSKISIRMLSRKRDRPITPDFLYGRVQAAWEYRKKVIDTSSCRVIFGEADFLPGLTVDKYEDILVLESLALGIDRLKPLIMAALVDVLARDGIQIRGIYERSDAKVRQKEGLPRVKGIIPLDSLPTCFSEKALSPDPGSRGSMTAQGQDRAAPGDGKAPGTPSSAMATSAPASAAPFDTKVHITENGVRYVVDVENGQKTGFFLDQKENRRAVARLCGGARVLDCFTHTGSFGLNAALAGAAEVTSVDASDLAIAQAVENARLNGFVDLPLPDQGSPAGLDVGQAGDGPDRRGRAISLSPAPAGTASPGARLQYLCADIFELLPALQRAGQTYDVVILDPPAFTKSRDSIKAAVRGYREINQRALRLVRDGGFLATCSCSHFMGPELFRDTIAQAARDAHKRLRQVYFGTQAPDHPILWASEESYYLKFYVFQVVEEK